MTEIIDLKKWTQKTVLAAKHICDEKQAPCVAFTLLFFDPTATPDEQWNFSIHLVKDPHEENPTEDEKKLIEMAFLFIQEGVKRIMEGKFDEFGKPSGQLH